MTLDGQYHRYEDFKVGVLVRTAGPLQHLGSLDFDRPANPEKSELGAGSKIVH